jgi:acyl-CoA thioester hydrolase
MPPDPTISEFRVRYGETDQMGVVYHANYLVWCEIGRTEYLRARGTSYRTIEESGVRLAVSEASVRYHAPARYDDVVRVTTTLAETRSRAITFEYVITDAEQGTRFATARTTLISLAANGRVSPLPPDLLSRLDGVAR